MGNFRPQGYLVLKMSRRASEDECGRFVNAAHAEFKKFALSVISANRSVRDLHLDRLVPESHKQLKVFTHRLITEKAKDGRYEAAREWLSNLGLGIYT